MIFAEPTGEQIDYTLQQSYLAFLEYRKLSFAQRGAFMKQIADGLENAGDRLLEVASSETNLPLSRLRTERSRTVFQLRSYADACERGDWLLCAIDTADLHRNPPKPDFRKTMVPLGPVVVFGASNFPFAYSTAGGDTASAFASGCTVVVKAHPAHPETSSIVGTIIDATVKRSGLHPGTFQHIHGSSFETGRLLVQHPATKAVGFTGSISGGMALFKWANERASPIPVFAEMGSTNPVFLFPGGLKEKAKETAKKLAASITLGLGQFCTKPGLIIGIEGRELDIFIHHLLEHIAESLPAKMLHQGIAAAYATKRKAALSVQQVSLLTSPSEEEGSAAIAVVEGAHLIQNPLLQEEVFGPYSLIVKCSTIEQMNEVARVLHGQLTATIIANDDDLSSHHALLGSIQDLCGRMIFNGVPTGVDVSLSMHHGGPFPASTDSRFTAVGADAIRRFARPVSYQDCPDAHLPPELQNENPLRFWRRVNNELTKDPVRV